MISRIPAQYQISRWYIVAIVCPFTCTPVGAQTVSASVHGAVLDPSGALVPQANVVVERPATNERHILMTAEAGSFSLPGLLPGTYRVTVEAQGFKTVLQD
jgi:hypothetical protein